MNTVLPLSLGLLLMASMVGCNTCGHQNCMHKAMNNGCGCGCHDGGACDIDAGANCDCGHGHKRAPRIKNRHAKSKMLPDAQAHGYNSSVVYTGEDYQGIPQQPVAMMGTPYSSGCSGCSGGPSISTMPSVGTIPSSGCAGCSGGSISTPPIQSSGCSSCGGGVPQQMSSPIPSSGGCASCGGNAGHESFYSPMSPNNGPAPAPPAESLPGHNESSPGDKAVNQGESIQKINWVPRQL